jgi:hypothetical protein
MQWLGHADSHTQVWVGVWWAYAHMCVWGTATIALTWVQRSEVPRVMSLMIKGNEPYDCG